MFKKLAFTLPVLFATSALILSPKRSFAISLEEGQLSMRQEFHLHQFSGYWNNSETSALSSPVAIYGTTFNGSWGIAEGWQGDLRLGYSASSFGADSRSAVSELGGRVYKNLVSAEGEGELGLDVSLGLRLPGTEFNQGNRVNALTDGVARVEAGAHLSSGYSSWAWGLDLRYAHRLGDPDDQIGANGYIGYAFSDRLSVGPVASVLTTLGGISVSEASAQGGLFSDLAEQHLGLGAFVNLGITETFGLSANLISKVIGQNTDQGTSLGLAANIAF